VTQNVITQIPVSFAGAGSGEGELSWGQQTVLRGVGDRGETTWLTATTPVPDGTTAEDVAELFGWMLSRYQSMRTRLLLRSGGQARQAVSASGETFLEIIDVPDDGDPAAAAQEREARHWETGRDFATEWPMKMSVVRHRGQLRYRITAMDHVVADGLGVVAMEAELESWLAGKPPGPVTALEPLEEAQVQASPAGRRRSQSAERHWAQLLRTIPARRFPPSAGPQSPRYAQAEFESPAGLLACQPIAARTGLDTSPVLLAAFAVSVARLTGVSPVVPRVMVSNRFRPRLADAVSPLTQTCLCPVDVAGVTFDQAVGRALRASLGASKNAYFEPVKIRDLVAAASMERGEPVDVALVYNDRRMSRVSSDGLLGTTREVTSMPEPEQLRAALPGTTLNWREDSDSPLDVCHFHILNSPDTLSYYVAFDTHYVARAGIEAIFRGIEEILVAAAFDPEVPTGVGTPAAATS
jgi:hypothetical protein